MPVVPDPAVLTAGAHDQADRGETDRTLRLGASGRGVTTKNYRGRRQNFPNCGGVWSMATRTTNGLDLIPTLRKIRSRSRPKSLLGQRVIPIRKRPA
jgi:hypothetical protein